MSEKVEFRDIFGAKRYLIISKSTLIETLTYQTHAEEFHRVAQGQYLRRRGRMNHENYPQYGPVAYLISASELKDTLIDEGYDPPQDVLIAAQNEEPTVQQHATPPPDEEGRTSGTSKTTISQQAFRDILDSDKPGQALFDILFRETPTPSDDNTSKFHPYRIVEKTTLECLLPEALGKCIRLEPAKVTIMQMLIEAGEDGVNFAALESPPANYQSQISHTKTALRNVGIPDHIHTPGDSSKGKKGRGGIYAIRQEPAPERKPKSKSQPQQALKSEPPKPRVVSGSTSDSASVIPDV